MGNRDGLEIGKIVVGIGINHRLACAVDLASSSSLPCWIQRAGRDQRLHRFPVSGSWEDDRVCVWEGDFHPRPRAFSVNVAK